MVCMQDFINEIVDRDFFYHHSLSNEPERNYFNLHMHEAFEIFYYIRGNARMNIEDRLYALSPSDLYFICPGRFHRAIPESRAPYERRVIRFDYSFSRLFDPGDLLIDAISRFGAVNGKIVAESSIPALFTDLDRFIDDHSETRRIACISILSRLMIDISKLCAESQAPVYESDTSERVASVIEYINKNLTDDLSLDMIASEFFVSKYYLSRIFKESTGSSIGDFIIKKRLVLARRLIVGGSTPGNACIQSGFADYSSFYKSYRKHFGLPPSACSSLR